MKILPLQMILRIVVAYFAMMIVLFLIFIVPQNREAKELKAKLSADPGYQATLNKEQIVALRSALEKAAASLESGPPAGENSVSTRISGLAEQAGTKVHSASPLNESLYKIIFSGSYTQVLKFVQLLESDRSLFQIERLSLDNDENIQRGELEARMYTDKAPLRDEAGKDLFWKEAADLLKKFATLKKSPPAQAKRELMRPALLTAVLFDNEDSVAIFDGKTYRIGDSIEGGEIVAMTRNQVIIQRGTARDIINLGSIYIKGAGQ